MSFIVQYYLIILTLIGVYIPYTAVTKDNNKEVSRNHEVFLVLISAFMIALVFAFRDIHIGADTERYYKLFDSIRSGVTEINILDDGGFFLLTKLLIKSHFSNKQIIGLYAFCYVFLTAAFAIRVKKNTLVIWMICLVSFVFVDLGINLIKAGLATAIALNAMLFKHNKRIGLIFAASFHVTALIYLVSDLAITRVKLEYLLATLLLAIAFLYFGVFEGIVVLLSQGIKSDELNLLRYAAVNNFDYKTGFRTDFIFFSILPIIYLFLLGKSSLNVAVIKLYIVLTIIFVCIMDFPFSNRVAYFSWILHGLLFTQGRLSRGLSMIFPAFFVSIGYILYMKYLWV